MYTAGGQKLVDWAWANSTAFKQPYLRWGYDILPEDTIKAPGVQRIVFYGKSTVLSFAELRCKLSFSFLLSFDALQLRVLQHGGLGGGCAELWQRKQQHPQLLFPRSL